MSSRWQGRVIAAATAAGLAATTVGASGTAIASDDSVRITQTNLVSDQAGHAALVDPDLVNPWGMSFGTGATATPVWVSDNGADVSTLYRGATTPPSAAKVPLTVTIPGGAPTGQVFNPSSTDFMVTAGGASAAARFIFASESGSITGWAPTVPAPGSNAAQVGVTVPNAVFKGLALASVHAQQFLYAADFHHGVVDVFDSAWTKVSFGRHAFRDSRLPKGFAPFNVQLLRGVLYVTYAQQDAARHDDVAGSGHGFVDAYSRTGKLLKRLVRRGQLDSPWGLAIAPSGWGRLSGALLVGNFGDGRIHAYSPRNGHSLGTLRGSNGKPLTIDGLWGLLVGNGVAGDPHAVLFTAGPDGEAHGLFGELTASGHHH